MKTPIIISCLLLRGIARSMVSKAKQILRSSFECYDYFTVCIYNICYKFCLTDIILVITIYYHKHVSKLLKWLKQWSYKLKTMFEHKNSQ